MGRRRQARHLTVAMNGLVVGTLSRITNGNLRFHYADEWLDTATAPPISLSMPLSPDAYSGDRVWNFFDNLLPDSAGIRGRIQASLQAESTRPFDLLAAAGRDCVGALQLYEGDAPPDVRCVEADPVSGAAVAERLQDLRAHPLGMDASDEFRISLAGAQEKSALLWWQDAWCRPRGATPTSHILKLPIGAGVHGIDLHDNVENEWLCLRLARAFGLPVPNAEIRDFGGIRVLVVERFDRRWSRDGSWLIRLPQEDLCQALALPPVRKYQSDGGPGIANVLDLLLQSQRPAEDRGTFFKALVVYWLLAAIDGHAKNFSLALLEGGRCELTPLYDVLSAHPIVARGQFAVQELRMAMAVDGKNRHFRWSEIQRRHWLSTAQKARFSEQQAEAVLRETAARAPSAVAEAARELPSGFPSSVADPILNGVLETARRAE